LNRDSEYKIIIEEDSDEIRKKSDQEDDLLLLLDALQLKIAENELKLEQCEELIDSKNLYECDKASQEDLIIQINELQNQLIQKSKDYELLNFEYENIKKEMDLTVNSLKEFKRISNEQNKQILRAMEIIKRNKIL
jgi:hypothetical protein